MRVLFVFALLIPCFAFSQQSAFKDDLLFTHFTAHDGLSNNETTCLLEDQRGFMWIGTTDGLNLYSANKITVYRNVPSDSLTLPDNIINSLAQDNAGHLWIATVGGISKMNLTTRKMERVYINNSDKPESSHSSFILLYDKQQRLWSADFGIDLYDTSCDCFHHYYNNTYQKDNDYKTSNAVTALFQDSKNRIWAGTRKGVYLFDPARGTFTKPVVSYSDGKQSIANYSLDATVTDIYEDHQHQLWLGTWGNGLIKFMPDQQQMISYPVTNPTTQKASRFNIASKISETKNISNDYHLWTYTDQGFAEFTKRGGFNYYTHSLQNQRSPSAGGARQMYTSSTGILWIAKETEGLDLLDPYRQVFKTHFFNDVIAPATQFGSVNSIYSSSDSVWIATWYGNALYITDSSFHILKKWERIPANSASEENNRANDIFKDKEGKIWISTLNGLHQVDLKTLKVKSYYHDDKDSTSLPSNRVVKYFEDSQGVSWVCLYRKGICQLDKRTGKFYNYMKGEQDDAGHVTSYYYIWDLMEDSNHTMWFADDAIGLWKYNRASNKLQRKFFNQLHDGHVATITEDATHTLWATTRNGLARINSDTLQLLTQADGFPTNTFFGARADKQNRLWILSNQGMILYDENKKIIKTFREDDGLEKIAVDGAVLHRLTDGRMVIGSKNYITEFDPAKIAFDHHPPAVYITDFYLFGKPYAWTETKQGKTITLEYDMNQFSFDFAVLNYSNPSENTFYYQLTGLDKEWNSSTQGYANYTNLSAGTYTFKVKGSNSDGTMNEEGDSIAIIIHPPFWKTWWFISLCFVIAFTLGYLFFRYRLRQALKLERMRMRISSDLHDDIGSTLSSISILSNMALREGMHNAAYDMVLEIKDNSLKLMERMDDIVWSINPENDTLSGLLLRVKQFSSKLFEAKGIDYEFDVPENISKVKLSMEYNQHIYLILKEAINNMIKYSGCTKAVVNISFSSPTLHITITDNGKGFATSTAFSGNGIKSMKNRAQMMNAVLNIDSGEDNGTVIALRLKIK